MRQQTFNVVAGMVFFLIAFVHALRLVFGWTAVINGWTVPHTVSWIALILFGALAYTAFQQERAKR